MPDKPTPSMENLIAAEPAELTEVTCASCCCLKVFLLTKTSVPEHFIATDQ
ncbi:MAG: hypothetical protein KAT90_09235 [Gammaproteobacteria bacterium]|nr:hypothetical protein [Gammaproteobacteria bacterium]